MCYIVNKKEITYLLDNGQIKKESVDVGVAMLERELSFHIRRKDLMDKYVGDVSIGKLESICTDIEGKFDITTVAKASLVQGIMYDVVEGINNGLVGLGNGSVDPVVDSLHKLMSDVSNIGEVIGDVYFDEKILSNDNKKVIQKINGGNTNMAKYVVDKNAAELIKAVKENEQLASAIDQELGGSINIDKLATPEVVAVSISREELEKDINGIIAGDSGKDVNVSNDAMDAVASYMGEYNTQLNWVKEAIESMQEAGIVFEEDAESTEVE